MRGKGKLKILVNLQVLNLALRLFEKVLRLLETGLEII